MRRNSLIKIKEAAKTTAFAQTYSLTFRSRAACLYMYPGEPRQLEKESAEKQQAQHKDHRVNYDFDKTHKISYP